MAACWKCVILKLIADVRSRCSPLLYRPCTKAGQRPGVSAIYAIMITREADVVNLRHRRDGWLLCLVAAAQHGLHNRRQDVINHPRRQDIIFFSKQLT